MESRSIAESYDAYYYAHDCGRPYRRDTEWLRFFDSIADRIISDIRPRTVLDVGCAMGFLVESLRRRGVEAFGIDISEYAIANVSTDIRPFCKLGQATDPLLQKYDLVVCIEVAEHLSPREAELAIENFCTHSNGVLFSSTPLDYKEATHVNVQPPEHWAELFARQGFLRDTDLDASVVAPWAVFFRPSHEPMHRVLRGYERRFWQLWQENGDLRRSAIEMHDQLAAMDQKVAVKDHQLGEILQSDTWQLALRLQIIQAKWAPNGTWRNRLLQSLAKRFGRRAK